MRVCGAASRFVLTILAAVVVVQVVSGRSSSAVEIDFDCGRFREDHGPAIALAKLGMAPQNPAGYTSTYRLALTTRLPSANAHHHHTRSNVCNGDPLKLHVHSSNH